MPLDRHDVMALLAQLAEEDQLKVAVQQSALGALTAGLGAFLGGLTLGPPGIFIGGAAGGGVGYAMTDGKFRSAAEVIRSLPPAQQRRLAASVQHLVSRVRADDAVLAAAMLASGMTDVRGMIMTQVVHFLTSELAMEVVRG